MKIDEMGLEWQHLGNNDWVLGKKVKGIVRESMAEVYFNEPVNDSYGWVWFINSTNHRGASSSLRQAIEAAELVLESILTRGDQQDLGGVLCVE